MNNGKPFRMAMRITISVSILVLSAGVNLGTAQNQTSIEPRPIAAPLDSESVVIDSTTLELPVKNVKEKSSRVHREKEVSHIRLNREDMRKIAAAQGDPMRAVSTLPGATTQSDMSVRPLVRGGKTEETQVLFEGIPLLQPYHFGSIYSIFNMESIQDLTLYSGGFPAEMGNALSGALFMRARPAPKDSLAIYSDLSLLRGNLFFGIPLIKNRLGISASYQAFWYDWAFNRGLDVVDLIKNDPRFHRNKEQIQTYFDLPNFKDLQLGASWTISNQMNLDYTGLISRDVFTLKENQPHYYVNDLNVSPNYYAWDLYYGKGTHSRERVMELDTLALVSVDNSIHSLRLSWKPLATLDVNGAIALQNQTWHVGFFDKVDWFDSIAADDQFAGHSMPAKSDYLLKIRNRTYDWKLDTKVYAGSQLFLRMGAAQSYRTSSFNVKLPRPIFEVIVNGNTDALDALGFFAADGFTIRQSDPGADSTVNYLEMLPKLIRFDHQGRLSADFLSAYGSGEYSFDDEHRLTLGGRIETDTYSDATILSPRAAFFHSLGSRDELTWAAGLYSQSDFPFQIRDLNPSLTPEKAFHFNLEWTHVFSSQYRLECQLYQKNYFDLVVPYLINTGHIDWTSGPVQGLDSVDFAAMSKTRRDSVVAMFGERKLNYRNGGAGKAAGSEISFFYNPNKTWGGWFSGEVSYSKRQDGVGQRIYDFRYQRPWAFNWINHFQLPNRFELAVRGRYSAGLPYTDYVAYGQESPAVGGGFSSVSTHSKNDTLFHADPKNSSRYSAYSRWDLRLGKKIPVWGHTLETYVELWNAFNKPNFLLKDAKTQKWKFVDLNYPIPILFMGISGRW